MKIQPIASTGQPQTFDVTETFFSTTDARGSITAGNHVFSRISGFSLEELLGQPHNIIRHPRMPRQVFRRLWDTIRAGNTFMGYVKNQAKNGNHYWVFALVVPIADGFLSVRIKPTSPLLRAVEALYVRMAECEDRAIAAQLNEGEAARASGELLEQAMVQLGFPSYDAFSHHALNTEIKSRDGEIATRSLRMFPEQLRTGADTESERVLRTLYAETLATYHGVHALFASLDTFTEISRGIKDRQKAVRDISEDFRLNALNAHIAAHPLGAEGVTLGTVAQILNAHGQNLSRDVTELASSIVATTTAVADITSNLSAARIQIEMLLTFLAEISDGQHDAAQMHRLRAMAEALWTAFSTTIAHALQALQTLERRLPSVVGTKEQLRKDIVYLQVAQISGLVEVSRLTNDGGLLATFTGLRGQIETGKRELEQLDTIVDKLKSLTEAAPPIVQAIERSKTQMKDALAVQWPQAKPARSRIPTVLASVGVQSVEVS